MGKCGSNEGISGEIQVNGVYELLTKNIVDYRKGSIECVRVWAGVQLACLGNAKSLH